MSLSKARFDEAVDILNLPKDGSFTAADVKRAKKVQAQKMHPDKGGSNVLLKQIFEAHDDLQDWIKQGKPDLGAESGQSDRRERQQREEQQRREKADQEQRHRQQQKQREEQERERAWRQKEQARRQAEDGQRQQQSHKKHRYYKAPPKGPSWARETVKHLQSNLVWLAIIGFGLYIIGNLAWEYVIDPVTPMAEKAGETVAETTAPAIEFLGDTVAKMRPPIPFIDEVKAKHILVCVPYNIIHDDRSKEVADYSTEMQNRFTKEYNSPDGKIQTSLKKGLYPVVYPGDYFKHEERGRFRFEFFRTPDKQKCDHYRFSPKKWPLPEDIH